LITLNLICPLLPEPYTPDNDAEIPAAEIGEFKVAVDGAATVIDGEAFVTVVCTVGGQALAAALLSVSPGHDAYHQTVPIAVGEYPPLEVTVVLPAGVAVPAETPPVVHVPGALVNALKVIGALEPGPARLVKVAAGTIVDPIGADPAAETASVGDPTETTVSVAEGQPVAAALFWLSPTQDAYHQ
jgi:hypothetical protein